MAAASSFPQRRPHEDGDDAGATDAGGGHAHRFRCPVPRCITQDPAGHAGWESFEGLRAHVDSHALPGRPPKDRLQGRNLVSCPECSRLVSRRCNGGLHRSCAAQRACGEPPPALAQDPSVDRMLASLPTLAAICQANIATQEFLGDGLLPLAEGVHP